MLFHIGGEKEQKEGTHEHKTLAIPRNDRISSFIELIIFIITII